MYPYHIDLIARVVFEMTDFQLYFMFFFLLFSKKKKKFTKTILLLGTQTLKRQIMKNQ